MVDKETQTSINNETLNKHSRNDESQTFVEFEEIWKGKRGKLLNETEENAGEN